jgi:hypothetical protein
MRGLIRFAPAEDLNEERESMMNEILDTMFARRATKRFDAQHTIPDETLTDIFRAA